MSAPTQDEIDVAKVAAFALKIAERDTHRAMLVIGKALIFMSGRFLSDGESRNVDETVLLFATAYRIGLRTSAGLPDDNASVIVVKNDPEPRRRT